MTKQEIFNTVCNGILSQGGPSIDTYGSCMYRGEQGRKCAAGWLIKDEDYTYTMERQTCDQGTPVGDYLDNKGIDIGFVRELQKIHDTSVTDQDGKRCGADFFYFWKSRMIKFAQINDLDHSLIQ